MRDQDVNRMSIHNQMKGQHSLSTPSWSMYHKNTLIPFKSDDYWMYTNKDPYLKNQIEVNRGYPDPERYFAERQLEENEKYIEENQELFNNIEIEEDKKRLINWYVGWFIPLCIVFIILIIIRRLL